MQHALAPNPLLSSSQAATLLGVHTASIKRWADQGKLNCVRTAGGHRRFYRTELEAIRDTGAHTHPDFVDRLFEAALAGEQMRTEGELLTYWSQVGRWENVSDAMGDMLRTVGTAWTEGDLLVSEEHVASETLLRSMARLLMMMPQRPDAPVCALATAPNDPHTLGLAMSELVLAEHNWKTLWIGRNCPVDTMIEVIERPSIRMFALSASAFSQSPSVLKALLNTIEPIARAHNTRIVLGGSGQWPHTNGWAERIHNFKSFGALLRENHAPRYRQQPL